MKDKKIFNILLIVVSFVIFCLTINVSAANTTVDATKCKDGNVYTNYYFFLESSAYNNGDGGTPVEKQMNYSTTGYYKNYSQGATLPSTLKTILDSDGFFSSEFYEKAYYETGAIPVKNNNNTLSLNGIGLNAFYNLYKAGSSTSSDGTISYLVEHNWEKVVNQDNITQEGEVSIIDVDNEALINATILLPDNGIDFSRQVGNSKSESAKCTNSDDICYPMAIGIIRHYDVNANNALATIVQNNKLVTLTYSDNVERSSYLQPALYYVQYCEKAEESEEPEDPDTFVVKYNANGGKNAPATSATTNIGTCVNISSDKPTRSGYTFLGWSRDSKASSANSEYAAGKCYNGNDGTITLYAIWKSTSTENPGTGVASHILSYIAIIGLGVGGLVLARKKGLFRQI